jgi:hypothetical protein
VAVPAVLWGFWSQEQSSSGLGYPSDVLGFLRSGKDKIEVRVTPESGAGLFTTSVVAKGDVMYSLDVENSINSRDFREVWAVHASAISLVTAIVSTDHKSYAFHRTITTDCTSAHHAHLIATITTDCNHTR